MRRTRTRLNFYVAVILIDIRMKIKYYKDRRGLEQEEVEAFYYSSELIDK